MLAKTIICYRSSKPLYPSPTTETLYCKPDGSHPARSRQIAIQILPAAPTLHSLPLSRSHQGAFHHQPKANPFYQVKAQPFTSPLLSTSSINPTKSSSPFCALASNSPQLSRYHCSSWPAAGIASPLSLAARMAPMTKMRVSFCEW